MIIVSPSFDEVMMSPPPQYSLTLWCMWLGAQAESVGPLMGLRQVSLLAFRKALGLVLVRYESTPPPHLKGTRVPPPPLPHFQPMTALLVLWLGDGPVCLV